MSQLDYTYMASPVGRILLAGGEGKLHFLIFEDGKKRRDPAPEWCENPRALREPVRQLEAYFAGRLREFELDLDPRGTAFQLSVWNALLKIPYGETTSYGELARRIGRPKASRAVGAANGANPLSIVIPCHRVIGASGALTGYGGGLPNKEILLELERGPALFGAA